MACLLGRIAISLAEQGSIGKVQVFTFFSAFASICTKLTLATADVAFHKCIHRSFLDVILSGGSSNCAALEILDELIGKQNIQ
jgi:hypothetical protein